MTQPHEGAALGRRVARGTFVLIFFGLFLKFGGLLMSIIMTGAYGPGHVLDAYSEVFNGLLFVFVYSSVLKVVVPAFMPVFAEEREKAGEQSAWRLTNTLLNMLLIGGGLLVVVGMILADQIVSTLVPGFDDKPARASAIMMLRYAMPGAIVLLFSVMTLGILNSYKIFSYPSAATAAHRLAWAAVLFVLLYGFAKDPHAAAEKPVYIGFLAGSLAQLIVLLYGMRKKLSLYRPRLSAMSGARILKEVGIALCFVAAFGAWAAALSVAAKYELVPGIAGNSRFLAITGGTVIVCAWSLLLWARASKRAGVMARFAALAGPLIIGVIFARYRDLITWYFQSFTQTGVFGSLEVAKTVANLPVELLPYSLSIAMFPYLCDLAARKDMGTFGSMMTRTVNLIALLFVPLTVVVIVMSRPVIELVFDRGNWPENMLAYAGLGLALYGSGFFFYAVENVLLQSYYSMQRVWTPIIVGIAATVFHAAFLFVLIVTFGLKYPLEIFVIVALSFPVSRAAKNLVLMGLLRKPMNFLPVKQTAVFAGKLCVVTLGVGLAAYFTMKPMQRIVPLSALKGKLVMLDTFNAEPRGWLSDEADNIKVAPSGAGAGFNGNVLVASYPWRSGQRVSLRRDVSDLNLSGATRLKFAVACRFVLRSGQTRESNSPFVVQLMDSDGEVRQVDVGETGTPELDLAAFRPAGADASRLTQMRIDYPLHAQGQQFDRAELMLDNVEFVGAERSVTADDFEPVGPDWATASGERAGASPPPGAEETEKALCVADKPVELARRLDDYRIEGVSMLTFKAQATRPCKLALTLVGNDGSLSQSEVDVRASTRRERYEVALSGFQPANEIPRGFRELRISETPAQSGGALWLDNIAFERPVQRLKYESAKFVILAVPSLAALIVFVVLCRLLRIEEAAMVVNWLRRRGWHERHHTEKP